MATVIKTDLPNPVYSGKVRDTYSLGDQHFLMIATDRISAFDVVLPNGVPDKGAVLAQISLFWFDLTKNLIPNHLEQFAMDRTDLELDKEIARRAMVVRKADRIDVECVVRGYITGSAWSEYLKEGTVGGIDMPANMKEGDRFPEPLFTPTTKAEEGHDEPITIKEMEDMVGVDVTRELKDYTLSLYEFGRKYAEDKGIIIADTKMEFGYIDNKIAPEATNILLNYGFSILGLHRIWTEIYDFDKKKKKLYKKIGFKVDGIHKETYWYGRKWHDSIFLSILSRNFNYKKKN